MIVFANKFAYYKYYHTWVSSWILSYIKNLECNMCGVPPSQYTFFSTPIVPPIKKVCAVSPLRICFFCAVSPHVVLCICHTQLSFVFYVKLRILQVPACEFSCQFSPTCFYECGTSSANQIFYSILTEISVGMPKINLNDV